MIMRILNIIFAFGCLGAIMFVPTTQQQILFATAAISNVIVLEGRNIVEQIKEN